MYFLNPKVWAIYLEIQADGIVASICFKDGGQKEVEGGGASPGCLENNSCRSTSVIL